MAKPKVNSSILCDRVSSGVNTELINKYEGSSANNRSQRIEIAFLMYF